jgi:hypothetical protein
MSIDGTPLRRFGRYLVTQPRRGAHPFWRVYDSETDESILYSEHRSSADEGARRLATSQPIYTPAEMLARRALRWAVATRRTDEVTPQRPARAVEAVSW